MTGRFALPISIAAAWLAVAALMPHATAQAVGPDEAHGAPPRLTPDVALSPAQKRVIYAAVSRQRLRSSSADIPLIVGAAVPRSAVLLTLPDAARGGDLSGQYLKYATVDDNVVLVNSITMRVIDIIHRAGP
jgi:hypothetical protein